MKKNQALLIAMLFLTTFLLIGPVFAVKPTPTPTPSPSPSPTPTVTPSPTPTPIPSPSPTPTLTPTPIPSPSPTPTVSPSPTPTGSTTPSSSPTPTPYPSPTPTTAPTPTPCPTPTPSLTPSPNPTATPTPKKGVASFSSHGTISYIIATPTPSPTSSPINLVPIPNGWSTSTNGMHLAIGGVPNDVLDYNVKYNGNPTIRQDPIGTTDNFCREVDGPYISIKPGDHIVFSVWIKTSASTLGDPSNQAGGAYGIDIYGSNGRITGLNSPSGGANWTPSGGWNPDSYLNFVPWGTNTWTLRTMDFVVPSTYFADPFNGAGGYSSGTVVVPTGIIPVLTVYSIINGYTDGGSAWFADTKLTINP